MKKTIFILSGKSGSGKSLASRFLSKAFKNNIDHIMYAGPLKSVTEILTGFKMKNGDFTRKQKSSKTKLGDNLTLREVFQILGNDCIRNMIDPDTFVKIAAMKINNSLNDYIVISDARYPNEINIGKYLKCDHEIIKIRLTREGIKQIDVESETALDNYEDWDCVIANNSRKKRSLKRLIQLVIYNYTKIKVF